MAEGRPGASNTDTACRTAWPSRAGRLIARDLFIWRRE